MNYQLTTIRDYLIASSHFYENAVKGLENWVIGPNCIFKTREQLEKYSDNCYQEDLKEWRVAFSRFCLENNILNTNAEIFEEFFDFDLSPYLHELHPDNLVKGFDQYYFSWEKCFKKFFEVCHPDMLKIVDLSPDL